MKAKHKRQKLHQFFNITKHSNPSQNKAETQHSKQTRTNPIPSPKSQNFTACPSGLLLTQNPSQLSCGVIVNSRTQFCFGDCHNQHQKGVCHSVALPLTLKSISRQKKKNYGNSNISPCQNIIFKKILYKKPKSFKIS